MIKCLSNYYHDELLVLYLSSYRSRFASQVSELFHLSVRGIRSKSYRQAQLQAWSCAPRSPRYWDRCLLNTRSWLMLAQDDRAQSLCCGFINMETRFCSRGYIASLYVHPNFQHQGIGEKLYLQAENWARAQQYSCLSVNASYLSKPLFLKQGFVSHSLIYQYKLGQALPGFHMIKQLTLNENPNSSLD